MSTPGGSENAWIWDAVATKAAKTSSLIPISINPTLLLSIQRGVERETNDSRMTDRTDRLMQVNSTAVQTPDDADAAADLIDGSAQRAAAQSDEMKGDKRFWGREGPIRRFK